MAKRTIPKNLGLHLPAYHTVLYEGVPMWRAQAWVIFDYKVHGGHYQVNSGIRTVSVIQKYRGHGLKAGYKSQQELIDGFARFGPPNWFPANPVLQTSHCGFSDGRPIWRKENGSRAFAGEPIAKFMWGLDIVDKPGGDARAFVIWANSKGYKAVRPYFPKVSERHHVALVKSPAARARLRLARWVATGR